MNLEQPENIETREYREDKVAIDLKGQGLDLRDLRDGKETEFEVDPDSMENNDEESDYFDKEELFKQLNYECIDAGADDDDSTPFSRMRAEMVDISNDGGVMKRILKHGAGPVVPPHSLCRVNYNAYLEYSDEPFDSSRLRGKQKQFKLGIGEVIQGWDIGVATMKRGEFARFMFSPNYGFGKLGCPPRIPQEATTLFEIELISFVDQGASDAFENFSEEERKQASFSQLLKVVDSLRLTGNESFSIDQTGRAAGKYSQALRLLENARLQSEHEETQWKEVCLKLYLNLSLCDLKQARSGRACKYARKALDIDKKNVKALYRLARALRQLGEYEEAKKHISKAHRLDPRNKEISEELKRLDEEMLRYRKSNQELSKRMLNLDISPKPEPPKKQVTSTESKMVKVIVGMLKKFNEDSEQTTEISIPGNLTQDEVTAVKETVKELGLYFYESVGSTKSYRVSKVPV